MIIPNVNENKTDEEKVSDIELNNRDKDMEEELFLGAKKDEDEVKGPIITSLEEIPKYSNVFVCVYPFIFYGYRIKHSMNDCLKSIFKLHNETLNIWTHLIPFFVFLFIFFYDILSKNNLFNLILGQTIKFENGGIIYLYIFTSCILFIFSSIHHTFSCHSNDTWNCCYKLDLTGIMFQLISATICSLHFMFHEFETIRRAYIIIFMGIGFIIIIFSLFDFFISAKLNIFVMFLYASLFLLSFLSSIHWVIIAKMEEVQLISPYILTGFLFMIVGFAIFLAKFPECLIQSKVVDYFFQSHIIWHLCCVGCVVSYYLMMYNYNLVINKIKK